jgi:CHAT domain-containing protein
MRATAHTDPVCSYKFRILKAEIIVSKDPAAALTLLDTPPPPELSTGEFAGRRKTIQGLAYAWHKDFQSARTSFDEATGYLASSKPELLVTVTFDQAFVASALQHDSIEAQKQYRNAITLARQYHLVTMEANAHINFGKLLMDLEAYDLAIAEFKLSLGLARSAQAASSEQAALGNMGWSYFQIGDFEDANSFLTKAEEIAERIQDTKNQELWLRDLGILFEVQDEYSKADSYDQRSLMLAQQIGTKDTIAINYHNLAQLEIKRGRLDKAEDYNRLAYSAEGLAAADVSDPYLLLTSAEIAQQRREFSKAEQYLNMVIHGPNADSSLRWQAQSDLANLYAAHNENEKAEAKFVEALQTVEDARKEIRQEDRRMSILDAWPFYDDYIRFLVNQGNNEKALQIAEFSRGRTLAEALEIAGSQGTVRLQASTIKNFLRKENQIILAYWTSDRESYLWFISPTQFQLFRLPSKDKIDRAVDAYNNEIRNHGETESVRGQNLYEMLIRPAAALLPANARVIIVPNRSLYKLNFESLVVPGKTPHYWIEDAVLENASSIALRVQARHRPASGMKKLLLMGAPVQETDEFPSLSFAADEVRSVAHHFSRNQETILAGKDATPMAYSKVHPGGYEFIHWVTHGTGSQTSPLDSAIVLSSDPDKSFKLYARDIKDIGPLRADLVTISACYGAGEKAYSGEGLVGLAWAFMRAGSHQVIAALWEVGDSSMPKLMDNFYSELGSGKSAAVALRSAKLAILHSKDFHKKPYYWASLQLYTGS